MKKKTVYLAAVALVLILSASLGSAMAYFTTNVEAEGSYRLEFGNETNIDETFDSWTKHVTISNTADSQPVYVRVRAFAGSEYELSYLDAGGKWTPGADGYYYYSDILNAGEAADVLDIRISNVPEELTEPENFNVAVIYESTPVQYDENGEPYADWSIKLDSGDVEGGAD